MIRAASSKKTVCRSRLQKPSEARFWRRNAFQSRMIEPSAQVSLPTPLWKGRRLSAALVSVLHVASPNE